MKVDEMKGNLNVVYIFPFEINGIIMPNVSIWLLKTTFTFLFSFFYSVKFLFRSMDTSFTLKSLNECYKFMRL